MLHAIVFDFDGVLADSEPLHFDAFRRVLAAHGVALTRERVRREVPRLRRCRRLSGDLADRGQPADDGGIDGAGRRRSSTSSPTCVGGRNVLFPGAAECVRRLGASVPLAIASGALSQDIDLILGGTGLREAFQVVVGAEQTPRSKPHPDPYARAVRLLQERGRVPTGAAAVAAASPSRTRAGASSRRRRPGCACVAVTTSYTASELGEADLVVRSLDDVSLDATRRDW